MTGSTEHRKAPRRLIKEVRKVGGWGDVKYHHYLECGHIEVRPRASTAPKIACVWCLRSEQKENEMKLLASATPNTYTLDDFATSEYHINSARAAIASKFGVTQDMVDVVVTSTGGEVQIVSATVFLSSSDVRRITGPTGR